MRSEDKEQALATAEELPQLPAQLSEAGSEVNILDKETFGALEAFAGNIASCSLIPQHYQGKPSDCIYAYIRAKKLGFDMFSFMEATYVVHGKLGLSGQMFAALANKSGLFEHNVRYEIIGNESDIDNMACIAWTMWRGTEVRVEGYCSVKMAKDEGWWGKSGSKWPTLTRMMLQYRAVTFLVRLNCPEIAMGYKLVDEIIDVEGEARIDGAAAGKKLFGNQEQPSTTLDAGEAEVVDEPTHEPTQEPVQQSTQEPAQEVSHVAEVVPIGKPGVPRQTMILSIKEQYKDDAYFEKFLLARGIISQGQTFDDISDHMLGNIWNNHAKFSGTYTSEKAKGK